jgi:hypothetical protein
MVLNHTQRGILPSALDPYFETLREIEDPKESIQIFEALSSFKAYNDETIQSLIEKNNVKSEADLLHLVYRHPCPQNRTTTNIYVDDEEDPDWIVYKVNGPEPGEHTIMRERAGLLSLTAYNDSTAEHVTKRDVDLYMNEKIEHEILAQRMRMGIQKEEVIHREKPKQVDEDDDVVKRSIQQYSKPQQVVEQEETIIEEDQNGFLQLLLLLLAFFGVIFLGEKTAKLARR